MKIIDMNNLWVGYNKVENFQVLICANDEEEAQIIANEYKSDSNFEGDFTISEFTNPNTTFDCDYILCKSQTMSDINNKDTGFAIKNKNGNYYTGYNNWDEQLRKAKIYHDIKYAKQICEDKRFIDKNPYIVNVTTLETGEYHE